MTPSVMVMGDTETALAASIRTAVPTATDATAPRAIVAVADLRGRARRDVEHGLKELAERASEEVRRHTGVRHIIFAVSMDDRAAARFDRSASAAGAKLHAELERIAGRDIEITFLDVSTCGDVARLTTRLLERGGDPAGTHGVVVLDWDDIRDLSIRSAARNEYL